MRVSIENILCPLCLKSDSNFLSEYSGLFPCCEELHQCNCCELAFCVELPSGEELDKHYSSGLFWDQESDPFSLDIVEFSINLATTRLSLINKETDVLNKKCKALDIGAGNASFGIALQLNKYNAIYDVVEPDATVRERHGSQVRQKFSDISDVEENNYDLVLLNQVLEHVPEPLEFIQSISKLIKNQGTLFIDVPFNDFLFKPSVGSHILFWSPESLSFLLERIGFKLIFCDTVGMTHDKAKNYFSNVKLLDKISDPWVYARKINQVMKKINLPQPFDVFRQFHANEYGGDRQWLRCIAQKTA
jgi:2-polyprenyl-3-methyl-5-hydroxy-6-metoxy-1,4-benzoquinol methylase